MVLTVHVVHTCGGYNTKEAWQGRLHASVDYSCFVFQRAPDLIISKVHDEDEVVLLLGCDDDRMDEEDRMEDSDASSNN